MTHESPVSCALPVKLPPQYRERWQNASTIRDILNRYKTIAMVGLSPNVERPSYQVADYLKQHGFHIIPVNPGHSTILEERSYPTLLDIPDRVDIVDIFRRPDQTMPMVDAAIQIKAKVIWFQLGVVNIEAGELAEQNGLIVVMDRCIKIEWPGDTLDPNQKVA